MKEKLRGFYFNDKYGKFTPVRNFAGYWVKEGVDIRVTTQDSAKGGPLALLVEITLPNEMKLDNPERKLCVKVNYMKIPTDNLPRLVQSLVNIFNFYRDRDDEKFVYCGVNGSYPYTITEEEYYDTNYEF